jgi:hypothetical protein
MKTIRVKKPKSKQSRALNVAHKRGDECQDGLLFSSLAKSFKLHLSWDQSMQKLQSFLK